jgi:hypothetical protein
MLGTLVPYLLIQIPAFAADCGETADADNCNKTVKVRMTV